MAEFRTASGLTSATPFLRTASGLVKATAIFFGTAGPVEGGGGEAPDVTAAANPASVFGTGRFPTITTASTTVSASGGKAPFAFAWALVDAIGSWEATSPAAATTAFRCTTAIEDEPQDATFRCTVTDANGKTATVDVTAQAYRYGSNDGTIQR
ncbi:hypothetical protein [Sphingomonas sp. SAFR-052]|uniref:hypothetical protein n=1 Tax=Sphingomonas sp. SAFR-052 TaxID=3436867 RepID=UPI003F7D7BEF